MKRFKIFLTIATLLVTTIAISQEKKADEKKEGIVTSFKTYREVVLEDFETNTYSKKNIRFRRSRGQKGSVMIRDTFAAPTFIDGKKSNKYLGVKITGKNHDVFKIRPAKKLIINGYCNMISIWVYGKKFSGELSIILKDSTGKVHRLVLGKLEFSEWRKLRIKLDKNKISQQDKYLNQKSTMEIMEIQYRPKNTARLPKKQYFYIDDISVMVRDKYQDRQTDDW